ncbi:hypothetical protein MLD38_027600 [Melastoma candidum]|uniref:Uncharacterized protein n=1 Tax=Melastoma candidum TaxID=119954 RepID=A0ACB9P3K7_9MYRT|nr:hypothetical protein MLD38_027600 [Melastoma candidum]
MELELQESEVIFVDRPRGVPDEDQGALRDSRTNKPLDERRENKKISRTAPSSPPVDIPGYASRLCDSEDYLDEDEMVPPHVIVRRRWASDGELSSSLGFSNGRFLKGRCLRQVRNSILRMTGFLES